MTSNMFNVVIRCSHLCRYYRCSDPDQDGVFDIDEYSCGDFIFDPNQLTCVDPDLPGNDNLCTS